MAAARGVLVLASAAAGLASPVDGVTAAVDDPAHLEADVAHGLRLGFGGKLCIHPRQVEVVHEALRPSLEQVAWAQEVLAGPDDGVVRVVRGQLVDRPVRRARPSGPRRGHGHLMTRGRPGRVGPAQACGAVRRRARHTAGRRSAATVVALGCAHDLVAVRRHRCRWPPACSRSAARAAVAEADVRGRAGGLPPGAARGRTGRDRGGDRLDHGEAGPTGPLRAGRAGAAACMGSPATSPWRRSATSCTGIPTARPVADRRCHQASAADNGRPCAAWPVDCGRAPAGTC